MPTDSGAPGALRYFREQDMDLLLSLGHRRSYGSGETIHVRGERLEQLLILEEGELEVVAPDGGARRLAAGDTFGASALARSVAAEETARAASDLSAIVLSRAALEELVRHQPETAARLCLGLAVSLASAAEAEPGEPAAGVGEPRSAAATARSDSTAASEARSAARGAERALRSLGAPEGDEGEWLAANRGSVTRALDAVSAAVERAARRSGMEAGEAVDTARAELAPLLERSRLAKRMHERQPEEPARYRALDHIYRNQPEGVDPAGLALDAYLLERPFAHALRERRRIVSELLMEEIVRRARPGQVVRVLTLGCGPARAIADVLDQPGMGDAISLTCVDDDPEAIVFANNLLKGHAPQVDLTLHQLPPSDVSYSEGEFRGFDVVASLFVANHIDTEALAHTIRQSCEWLNPGGVLLLGAFPEDGADRWVTSIFLNWRPARHSPEALEKALAGMTGSDGVNISRSPEGGNLVVRAVRRG